MSGWIKLHRKLLNCPHIKNANQMSLFICMLLRANHEEKKSDGRVIPRGSFTAGRRELAKQSRIPEHIARTAIKHFVKYEMVTVESLRGFSIFSIVNYDFYQSNFENIQPRKKPGSIPEHNPTNSQTDLFNPQDLHKNYNPELSPVIDTKTARKEATLKELQEYKEDKNILSLFESFWKVYTPVKVNNSYVEKGSKKQALNKFIKILNKGSQYEEIINGMQRYLKYCKENEIKSCGVNVFLNQERWLDDYSSITVDAESSGKQHQRTISKAEAISKVINAYRN